MVDYFPSYIFGIAAGTVSITGFFIYIGSVVKGRTRPSGPSWWTWTLFAGIIVTSSWFAGAPWQVLILPLSLCISQFGVALLSIKYGDNNWGLSNKIYVSSALLAIVLWFLTGEPLIALIFSIIADFFASIPNFRHTWIYPAQENRTSWTLDWFSAILEIFTVSQWSIIESGWAIYFLLNMSVMLILVWRPSFAELSGENVLKPAD